MNEDKLQELENKLNKALKEFISSVCDAKSQPSDDKINAVLNFHGDEMYRFRKAIKHLAEENAQLKFRLSELGLPSEPEQNLPPYEAEVLAYVGDGMYDIVMLVEGCECGMPDMWHSVTKPLAMYYKIEYWWHLPEVQE